MNIHTFKFCFCKRLQLIFKLSQFVLKRFLEKPINSGNLWQIIYPHSYHIPSFLQIAEEKADLVRIEIFILAIDNLMYTVY